MAAGLADRLDARLAGRLEAPPYDKRRDPDTKLLNPQSLAQYSVALADVIESVLGRGEFPVVLGGDCSIPLGCTLATRRRGRAGLGIIHGPEMAVRTEVASASIQQRPIAIARPLQREAMSQSGIPEATVILSCPCVSAQVSHGVAPALAGEQLRGLRLQASQQLPSHGAMSL